MTEKNFYTLKEAGALLNIAPSTLREAIQKGTLRGTKEFDPTGRAWGIKLDELCLYYFWREKTLMYSDKELANGIIKNIKRILLDKGILWKHEND